MNKNIIRLAAACLLVGIIVIFYYPVRELLYTAGQKREIAMYRQEIHESKDAYEAESLNESEDAYDSQDVHDAQESSGVSEEQAHLPDAQAEAFLYPELYKEIQAYNESIFVNGQKDLKDAWSYEQPPFVLKNYGMDTGIFGVLTIPAMDIELPVYLGASLDNLSKGAAILGQTSIPIGQENSNCVIAGHRGWPGKPMFRDIEELSVGDDLQFENPWETQTYRVSEIAVIEPQDIDAIHIQEGRTMLTLITCHPYGQNYNRYVVYCQQVKEGLEDNNKINEQTQEQYTQSGTQALSETQETDDLAHTSGEMWGKVQRTLEKLMMLAAGPLIVLAAVLLFKSKSGSG